MSERSAHCGMGKGKVCVFLVLVGVGLVCLLMMVYMLFYARPRADPTIKDGRHSSLRLDSGSSVRSSMT